MLQGYPPGARVGAFLATHEFLAGLAAEGHDVHVYKRLSRTFHSVLDGVHVHPGYDDDPVADAIRRADVVVSHAGMEQFASQTAHELGVPDVRMVHSPPPDGVLECASLAIFNSRSCATEVGWDGPQIVIHPPIRRGLTVKPGSKVTLVHLATEKGGDLFWKLARAMPDVEFLGVKGGYGYPAGIYPRDNVAVVDTTENMASVYAQTRILLMPSARESYGLVGVEAMSCGIPVIAHPTSGLRESLGDAGLFVDRADEPGWVDAITRLRDAGEWQVASTRAQERAAALDPVGDIARFVEAIESFDRVAA